MCWLACMVHRTDLLELHFELELVCRETEMRKAHDTYMSGVERDAKQREAERRAEADRLRRNEVSAPSGPLF